jgi:fibronectin type 3 domain-containing protein
LAAGVRTYTDTGLAPDSIYTYRVRAVNADGPSPYSNSVEAATLPPLPVAPTNLAAQANGKQVELTWVDRSNNERDFLLERQVGSGAFVPLNVLPINSTSYTDRQVLVDTRYTYRLRSRNAAGVSPYSNSATAQTLATPTTLQATLLSSTQVGLRWKDASTLEAAYVVERRLETGEFSAVGNIAANNTSFTDVGAVPETPHTYRVRARQGSSYSAYTALVTVTPMAAPVSLGGGVDESGVLLSWEERSDVEAGYQVERQSGTGAFSLIGRVGTDENSYADRTVAPLTRYSYRVRAYSAAGVSSYSNVAPVQTPSALPLAPTRLTASSAVGAVELAWEDQSSNETAFQVERRGGPSGSAFRLLATTIANSGSYRDSGVAPGVTYTYRVRAVNRAGASTYSNEASATPLSGLLSFTVRPTRIKKGSPATGKVQLTGPAPAGGARIILTRSSDLVKLPASVTVAAGKRAVSFSVQATRKVKKAQTVILDATYGSVTKSTTVRVIR